jgi:hypothetical protein
VRRAPSLIAICDKYDCLQFVKIIKDRLVYLILNEENLDPWDFFELGCQMEWEYLAKEALRKFRIPKPIMRPSTRFDDGACDLPQYLSNAKITGLGLKAYIGYVRAFIAEQERWAFIEQERCSGQSKCSEYQWNKIADKFSFHDSNLDGAVEY